MYPIFFDDEKQFINVPRITRMTREDKIKDDLDEKDRFPLTIRLGYDYVSIYFLTEEERENYIKQMMQGTANAVRSILEIPNGKSEIPKYPPREACNACDIPYTEPPDLSRLKEE